MTCFVKFKSVVSNVYTPKNIHSRKNFLAKYRNVDFVDLQLIIFILIGRKIS